MTAPHVIWIIVGECYDGSDHSMWVVCWRHTEDEAKAVVAALEAELKVYRDTLSELRRRLKPWVRPPNDENRRLFEASHVALIQAALDPNINEEASYVCQPIADDARAFALELAARTATETAVPA